MVLIKIYTRILVSVLENFNEGKRKIILAFNCRNWHSSVYITVKGLNPGESMLWFE